MKKQPPAVIGEIAHRVLAELNRLTVARKLPDDLREFLIHSLGEFLLPETAVELALGIEATHDRNIGSMLDADTVLIEEPLAVRRDEKLVPCEWNDPAALFRGIPDLAMLKADTATIIDYKTGFAGMNRLQALYLAMLMFTHYPMLNIIRVVWCQPLMNWYGEPIEFDRAEQGEFRALAAAANNLRTRMIEGRQFPLSYSSMSVFYRCPRQFAYNKRKELGFSQIFARRSAAQLARLDADFPARSNPHCAWCPLLWRCPDCAATEPVGKEEAQALITEWEKSQARCDAIKALLRAYCDETGENVQQGTVVFGYKLGPAKMTVNTDAFLSWCSEQVSDETGKPIYPATRMVSLRPSKAVEEAVLKFSIEQPDQATIENSGLRFGRYAGEE